MALDMQNWSRGQSQDEDPVPFEELPPEQVENLQSGSGNMTTDQLENLVQLVRPHLQQIEEQVMGMDPNMLLAEEMELPEDLADPILELVDTWGDGLPEMLQNIDPADAITVSQALADEVTEAEPILIGAWLWRAGQLT